MEPPGRQYSAVAVTPVVAADVIPSGGHQFEELDINGNAGGTAQFIAERRFTKLSRRASSLAQTRQDGDFLRIQGSGCKVAASDRLCRQLARRLGNGCAGQIVRSGMRVKSARVVDLGECRESGGWKNRPSPYGATTCRVLSVALHRSKSDDATRCMSMSWSRAIPPRRRASKRQPLATPVRIQRAQTPTRNQPLRKCRLRAVEVAPITSPIAENLGTPSRRPLVKFSGRQASSTSCAIHPRSNLRLSRSLEAARSSAR